MVKIIYKYFLILFLLLSLGCSDDKKEVYVTPQFKETIKKEIEIISQPITTFQFYGLESIYNYLVVLAPIDNSFVHIFDKSTGELVSSSVARGRANNELLYINSYVLDKSNGILTLYDATSSDLLKLKIEKSGECKIEPKIDVNISKFISSVSDLGDDKMLLFSNTPNIDSIPRLSLLNRGEIASLNNEQPISDNEKSSKTYSQARLSLSSDKTKMVIGTIFGSILETYSIKGNKIKHDKTSYFIEPKFENNTIWGMGCITSSDDYIYSVYNGSDNVNGFNKIALFSWSHKPLELWDVGNSNIACLSVDGDNVYAIADQGDGKYRIVIVK